MNVKVKKHEVVKLEMRSKDIANVISSINLLQKFINVLKKENIRIESNVDGAMEVLIDFAGEFA